MASLLDSWLTLLQPTMDRLQETGLTLLPEESFGDISVRFSCTREQRFAMLPRLRIAFGELQERAPMWHRRVQRELRYVHVLPMGPDVAGGWYDSATRVCAVNVTPLMHTDVVEAAITLMLVLVHESTHAWLARHGVRFEGEARRIREELICNRAEASLAARLGSPALERIVAARRVAIPEQYSDASLAARRQRRAGA